MPPNASKSTGAGSRPMREQVTAAQRRGPPTVPYGGSAAPHSVAVLASSSRSHTRRTTSSTSTGSGNVTFRIRLSIIARRDPARIGRSAFSGASASLKEHTDVRHSASIARR